MNLDKFKGHTPRKWLGLLKDIQLRLKENSHSGYDSSMIKISDLLDELAAAPDLLAEVKKLRDVVKEQTETLRHIVQQSVTEIDWKRVRNSIIYGEQALEEKP